MPIESDSLALTDGAWVMNPRTRVLEWQFYPPDLDAEPPIQDLVACPFCDSPIGQPCRTPGGYPRSVHSQRIKSKNRRWVVEHIRGQRGAPTCGTDSGYYHHRRKLKEPACDACRAAHRDAERDRKKRAA